MTEIKKVSQYSNGTKAIIIPKHSEIKAGDFVKIDKIDFGMLNNCLKENSEDSD